MKLLSLSKWLPYISADILNKIPGVLAISVLVGCYGGYLYAIAAIENAPEWYYLARPPEEIENLLAAAVNDERCASVGQSGANRQSYRAQVLDGSQSSTRQHHTGSTQAQKSGR
jgi:hypothetical protein